MRLWLLSSYRFAANCELGAHFQPLVTIFRDIQVGDCVVINRKLLHPLLHSIFCFSFRLDCESRNKCGDSSVKNSNKEQKRKTNKISAYMHRLVLCQTRTVRWS